MKYQRLYSLFVLYLFLLSCSSSDNTDSSNNQAFVTPDPTSETVVGRLGYTAARDAIDEMVSSEFLNRYFELENELLTGNMHSGSEPGILSCPGGGTVSCVSNGCIYPLSELSYDNCVIDGKTLTGTVERRGTSFPFATGGSKTLEEDFTDFSIVDDTHGTVEFSGSVKRSVVDSQFDTGVSREFTVTRAAEVMISSARLESVDGLTELSGNYTETSFEKTIINADESQSRSTAVGFEGAASILSALFGEETVSATKSGKLVTGVNEAETIPVTLTADFGDASTLGLVTNANTHDSVQVDIVSGDVSVSFVDGYQFEPRLVPLE